MSPKEIVVSFVRLFKVNSVNFPQQMRIVKKLLEDYTDSQIIYAMNYYYQKGVNMYSLGFLTYNMPEALRNMQMQTFTRSEEGSGERNKNRIKSFGKTWGRKEYPCDMFTETREIG